MENSIDLKFEVILIVEGKANQDNNFVPTHIKFGIMPHHPLNPTQYMEPDGVPNQLGTKTTAHLLAVGIGNALQVLIEKYNADISKELPKILETIHHFAYATETQITRGDFNE